VIGLPALRRGALKGQAEVHGVIIRKHLLIRDKFEDLINPFDHPAPVLA
jgi:hypothetical protein